MNKEILERIEALHIEWRERQPLTELSEKKLWLKLRLEWNYNSNHIEGNTLTYGETELLFIHGQTNGDHTLREYEEMKAHDVAIARIRDMAEDSREISEADIRNLNKIILKEPFWKEANTLDSQPSRKKIVPGEYKKTPNNVRTATGEIFEFASPMDVPARMGDLVQSLRCWLTDGTPNLIEYLAKLHHEFLLIHPFDDGNGRVARLLINYVLINKKYPPIIIKSNDKKNYLLALRKADVGDPSGIQDYLAQNLIWSLELAIKAAKGEDIEESSDIEKEIALFVRNQFPNKADVRRKNFEDVRQLSESSWKPLFRKLDEKTFEIGKLFLSRQLSLHSPSKVAGWETSFDQLLRMRELPRNIQFNLQLHGYQGAAITPFNIDMPIQLMLDDYEYRLVINNSRQIKKLYSAPILSDEADQIIQDLLKSLFERIKKSSGIT